MTVGELLREGLTFKYSLLSIKILMILNAAIKARDEGLVSPILEVKEKEALNRAKILVDKMATWFGFIEGVCYKKEIDKEKEGYLGEGSALVEIISNGYHEQIFLSSSFFGDISRSLGLLTGDFSLDHPKLEQLRAFFDKFQKELSSVNNAHRYGVTIL